MKHLWHLPVLLLLALPVRAQTGDEPAPESDTAPEPAIEQPAPQDSAPASDEPAEPAAAPEPNSSDDGQPSQGGASANSEEGGAAAEKPVKEEAVTEEPVISVKLAAPSGEEADEDSITPALAKKKVVPTATIMNTSNKGKTRSAVKSAKGKKAPPVLKKKAPIVAEAPPPVLVSAVPLTPITPRNP